MNCKEFIDGTINSLDELSFESLKQSLVGEYIRFSFISDKDLTRELLAEKVNDYFEKLEFKIDKPFDKQIQIYAKNLQAIIENRIVDKAKSKKKKSQETRAKKYYDFAQDILDSRDLTTRNIIDYSRIMMCLYIAIINNDFKAIDNLDFAPDVLNERLIIAAMKNEKVKKIGSKLRFDTKELYCMDTCTFIITIIMLRTIANERG